MKRNLILVFCFLQVTSALFAQKDYKSLCPVSGLGLAEKLASVPPNELEDYLTYLYATHYYPPEFPQEGPSVFSRSYDRTVSFDREKVNGWAEEFLDSLSLTYRREPQPGGSLFSVFPFPGDAFDNRFVPVYPDYVAGGWISAPVPVLDHASVFVTCRPADPSVGCETVLQSREQMDFMWHEGKCHFSYSLPLLQDSRETRELTVGIVPPPGYDRVSLTPDRVGDTLWLGDIPLKLLAFGPGVVHLQCPKAAAKRVMAAEQFYMRDSMWLGSGNGTACTLRPREYALFRSHPGMNYKQYKKFRKEQDLSDESEEVVLLFLTGYDAGKVVLNFLRSPEPGEWIAARRIGYKCNADGGFAFFPVDTTEVPCIRQISVMPYFPEGGAQGFAGQLSALMPTGDVSGGLCEGRIVLQLLIGEDGGISSYEIIEGNHLECKEKVLRAMKSMEKKKWIPAMINGVPVRVAVIVPVVIKYV